MRTRLRRILFSGVIMACIASCRSPMADAQIAEQMKQLGDELNYLRQDAADLHGQLDSVRTVVVRQDTLIRQLAGMAGVPVPNR